MGGGGEHGLVRLRKRRNSDPIPLSFDQHYTMSELSGEPIWNSGAIPDGGVSGASLALKHGWEGHNYIGLADTWGTVGMSDNQILDLFNVSTSIRQDATSRANLLYFLRLANGG